MAQPYAEIVQTWWDRLSDGDVAVDLWHPEARIDNARDWPVAASYHGREGVRQWWDDIAEAFEITAMTLEQVIDVDDDRVLTVQRFRARFRLTGIEINEPWASVLSFRDGLIVHAVGYLSKREALEAVGLD